MFKFSIKSSDYYRKILLPQQAMIKWDSLYNLYKNIPFYVMLDEKSNRKHQSILNIFIGKLKKKNTKNPIFYFQMQYQIRNYFKYFNYTFGSIITL